MKDLQNKEKKLDTNIFTVLMTQYFNHINYRLMCYFMNLNFNMHLSISLLRLGEDYKLVSAYKNIFTQKELDQLQKIYKFFSTKKN